MNKKGFTLIELLGVIVILAVIAVIAIPIASNVITSAKTSSYKLSAQNIIKSAEDAYAKNNTVDKDNLEYTGHQYNVVALNYSDPENMQIALYENDTCIYGTYTNIKVATLTEDACKKKVAVVNECSTGNTTLTVGDTFTEGSYTYRYGQELNGFGYSGAEWGTTSADGWWIGLTDDAKPNTGAITDAPCTTIDGKPIVSMAYTFYGSKASSVDLSKFDTSNVTNMFSTFYNMSNVTSLDLSNFNTSKVTNMSIMFDGCSSVTNFNISSFNTSNVTDMSAMFDRMTITSLDVSNFDTSKVTDFAWMFAHDNLLTDLNLTNFDTSKATSMSEMFYYTPSLNSVLVSSKWVVKAGTDTNNMFVGSKISAVTKQ